MIAPSDASQHWNIYPLLSKEQFQLVRQEGIDSIHAQLLWNRGLKTPDEMKVFLRAEYQETSDPLTFVDMPKAVARIRQALANKEHITVYGDYDADGVTSSSLLFRALDTIKHPDAPLDYHIPHRLRDGCGLNLPALDMLKARGTRLIITTDCASSDVEQIAHANQLGIDVIITDHHRPPVTLPPAYAMVNPWLPGGTDGARMLCGVGIAFKLVQALYRAYKRDLEYELALLDLVAIGTIADVAPLLEENHTLVRLGLARLNATKKPGLQALIRKAGLQPGRIRERDIAFALAPRINAAGRMQDASIAFNLLTTDKAEEAEAYAQELERLNQQRQQETETLMQDVRMQAQQQPTNNVILAKGDDWHEGIIGLVAGKLAEEIDKPVLVLSNDRKTQLSRGSARSRKGYNLIEALRGFASQLERYGGHSQAAGFTIRSEYIDELHNYLLNWQGHGDHTEAVTLATAQSDVAAEVGSAPAPHARMIDLTLTKLDRITYALYKEIRQLAPFGMGNPEPVFKADGLRLIEPRLTGSNKQHLSLRIRLPSGSMLSGTMFNGAHRRQDFLGISHVNVTFRLESPEDEAKQEIWLRILDLEPSKT
ncbi:MAG TPA: single-stranded-DNA-specific exonuclease RecJ [Ktedonobacteraceae bacterium]